MTGWVNDNDYEVNGNLFNETTAFGFGDFMKVFQPEMIAGSTDALEKKDNVLIPASMAMRMFGSTDAVGKMLFQGKQSDNKPVTVGGVYKDFPENSQIGNHIFMPFDPDQDKNDWGNWNYTCYYRLDNPANVSEVEKLAFQRKRQFQLLQPCSPIGSAFLENRQQERQQPHHGLSAHLRIVPDYHRSCH